VASVEVVSPAAAQPPPASTEAVVVAPALASARKRPRSRMLWAVPVVGLAGALAAIAIYWLAGEPVTSAGAEPAAFPNSVAVLPLVNLSPDPGDAYFAVGIHEEILNQLTKIGDLWVASRMAVQGYAGTQLSTAEIARELNVETVLDGSVRYADGRVVVTTRLSDETNETLWSESYERAFSNIFAVQSDIAVNVAQALKTQLSPVERARIDRVPTSSLAAYELYLSALAHNQRQTREAILLGLEEIDEALALDPQFAPAWALKAELSAVAPYRDPQYTAEYLATGERAARRAVELDPELGQAHGALGFALFQRGDWIGSENAFRTALRLRQPLGDMAAYSTLQLAVGNFAFAREILQEAREAVPENPTALGFLLLANALLGDWATATRQYELGTRLFTAWDTGDNLMRFLRVARNEIVEARAIPAISPVHEAMTARLEAPEDALRELRRMYADPAFADPVSQRTIATWAATFGDPTLALEAIRSAATRSGGNIYYVWLPNFRAARQRPEFKELVRDLGLVAYWEEFDWPGVCLPLGNDDFECH
jgi:TolB-like protein/Tfp pilus assembly protein PilF